MSLILLNMDIFSWRFVINILLVSEGCDDLNIVTFTCEFLTGYSYHDFLHYGFLFSTNSKEKYYFPWTIVGLLVDIGHFMILKILSNDNNWSATW